ncbi:MAG: hypothetical protein SF028_05350 [Candidatus Sumerlaeia bacterium]|nr:hypothetical protein [Candidatus Sumerlaeia bacterium]
MSGTQPDAHRYRAPRPAAATAAAALTAAALAWGAARIAEGDAADRWADVVRAGTEAAILAFPDPPRTHGASRELARAAEEGFFPPRNDEAARFIEEALRLDPLRAGLWMQHARLRIAQGRRTDARISLLRSDELDPNFPAQRLEAVQLWVLLGETGRAYQTARQLAAFGPRRRNEAARELTRSGLPPEVTWHQLGGEALEGAELGDFLKALDSRNAAENARLLDLVPAARLADAEFRRRALEVALDPPLAGWIDRLWRPSDPATTDSLALDAPRLDQFALADPWPLGWQHPGPRNRLRADAYSPPNSARPYGTLSLRFTDWGEDAPRAFGWRFYRLPVPAGETAAFRLSVRLEPPGSSRVRLLLREGRSRRDGTETTPAGEWQELSVLLPAEDRDRVVDLQVERVPADTRDALGGAVVEVGNLRAERIREAAP